MTMPKIGDSPHSPLYWAGADELDIPGMTRARARYRWVALSTLEVLTNQMWLTESEDLLEAQGDPLWVSVLEQSSLFDGYPA